MNYIEEHGKKVAAVLCVASCFPVVAAVYAMETEPGWHGDRYIKQDASVAIGWQEIEGKSYYFDETGTVDQETTQKATVATVSNTVTEEVQANVTTTTKEVVQEEVKAVEEQKAAEEAAQAAAEEAAKQEQAAQEVVVEQTPAETPVVEEPSQTVVGDTTVTVVEETTSNVTNTTTPPSQSTTTTPSEPATTPSQPTTTPSEPTVTTPSEPVVTTPPAESTTTTTDTSGYADLNARIAASAQTLVGVTDGQQCTQVVQQALALAGVSDAYQLWPDQYIMYGYYTDTPQAGNLVYYNNGGRGLDHIAVYIGNGMCVHGNFWTSDGTSQTIIASVYYGGGGTPQFIQVTR